MDYADINDDGRLDIVSSVWPSSVYILYQPTDPNEKWDIEKVGSIEPDMLVSVALADINGDGYEDIFSGSYSLGSRDKDDTNDANRSYGSVVWFENKIDSWKKNNILSCFLNGDIYHVFHTLQMIFFDASLLRSVCLRFI